ncbi:MAG: hypothetical protein LBQ32_02960 [Burkholderiaceae bacterium]|jgi:hypothetical protein|nr:hypothetical protein [Burkholderiaceae bacterium]
MSSHCGAQPGPWLWAEQDRAPVVLSAHQRLAERRPLLTREVALQLVGSVRTTQGLRVGAELDENAYATGIKASDEDMTAMAIKRDDLHEECNYRFRPHHSPVQMFKLFLLVYKVNYYFNLTKAWYRCIKYIYEYLIAIQLPPTLRRHQCALQRSDALGYPTSFHLRGCK